MENTTSNLVWIPSLLIELHLYLSQDLVIWCDNLSSMTFASNPMHHAQTKYIKLDFHYVWKTFKQTVVYATYLRIWAKCIWDSKNWRITYFNGVFTTQELILLCYFFILNRSSLFSWCMLMTLSSQAMITSRFKNLLIIWINYLL